MKIVVTHPSSINYREELYAPLRNSRLNSEHKIFLPHEKNIVKTRDIIQNCDLILAEISYPSTGQGYELGWADIFKIPILFFCKKGSNPSPSLRTLMNSFIWYEDADDMIKKLTEAIENL